MISFIIPAHNEEHELAATLQAITAAAAGRTYELIVVDDDSTDATAEIARGFGARVEHVQLRQIAAVRNGGARVANGEILFFVDADTHINAVVVTAALRALDSGCVGGSARLKLDREVPFWASLFITAFCAIYFAANLGVGAFIFTRRADFEAIGGFDEQYFAGEEVYLTLALRKRGRFVILREPVTTSARKVRMHSGANLLRQWLAMLLGGKRVLRQRKRLDIWYDGKREHRAS
jgi:glycosyltransferase involved in cell wall biosynthesis